MLNEWKASIERAMVVGATLEAFGNEIGLGRFEKFVINSFGAELMWPWWSEDLATFVERVKQLSNLLGRAPDETTARCGDYNGSDMTATWGYTVAVDGSSMPISAKIILVSYDTRGCKVLKKGDPVVTTTQKEVVHPECVQVVDALEDLTEADWADAVA